MQIFRHRSKPLLDLPFFSLFVACKIESRSNLNFCLWSLFCLSLSLAFENNELIGLQFDEKKKKRKIVRQVEWNHVYHVEWFFRNLFRLNLFSLVLDELFFGVKKKSLRVSRTPVFFHRARPQSISNLIFRKRIFRIFFFSGKSFEIYRCSHNSL